jgi:hypothetical protein
MIAPALMAHDAYAALLAPSIKLILCMSELANLYRLSPFLRSFDRWYRMASFAMARRTVL